MQETEAQEIISLLLDKARENKHTEIRLITTYREFRAVKKQARALKVVLKILRNSANSVFKSYCKEIVECEQDITKLLAYNQLFGIAAYYKRELEIITEMITEYDKYLDECNYIATLFGAVREV